MSAAPATTVRDPPPPAGVTLTTGAGLVDDSLYEQTRVDPSSTLTLSWARDAQRMSMKATTAPSPAAGILLLILLLPPPALLLLLLLLLVQLVPAVMHGVGLAAASPRTTFTLCILPCLNTQARHSINE